MEGKALSFEEAFGVLEQTVRELENGNLAIDDAVKLYQKGMEMARLCADRLDAAELRVNKLAEAEDGEVEIAGLDIRPG